MSDILDQIVSKRRDDIARLGLSFGFDVPEKRSRPVVPFLESRGVILEVKRASPSKGDIAPELDAAECAARYEEAGAAAISVLTEQNYFKGSLKDLAAVASTVKRAAVLRKDFLLLPEEIKISYKCGADAVLLISRILDRDSLLAMAKECERLGITAFVELRLPEDIEKFAFVSRSVDRRYLVCGVNSRDLSTFRTDLLYPCVMLDMINRQCGEDTRVVFESGILTPAAAQFPSSLGFWALLLGEAAARSPGTSRAFVESFLSGSPAPASGSWKRLCRALAGLSRRPLIKICGLTNTEDAMLAMSQGADLLGFILSDKSPRGAKPEVVERAADEVRTASRKEGERCPLVACVITELGSPLSDAGLRLAESGAIDFLQLHAFGSGDRAAFLSDARYRALPHYFAESIGRAEDLDVISSLKAAGEPRVLVDSHAAGLKGGTGKTLSKELTEGAAKRNPLWLAGGINPDNIADLYRTYSPELMDVSSGVEARPGKKDGAKLRALFRALDSVTRVE